jgi:hydrogenase nickel incorporation protein HypA/HybF
MHELAITESIVSIVAEHAGAVRVTRVVVEIGKLSGVAPDAVRFCFDVCSEGTALAGAGLDIIETRARGRCRECGGEVEIEDFLAPCACGNGDLELVGGQEVRVKEIEVT